MIIQACVLVLAASGQASSVLSRARATTTTNASGVSSAPHNKLQINRLQHQHTVAVAAAAPHLRLLMSAAGKRHMHTGRNVYTHTSRKCFRTTNMPIVHGLPPTTHLRETASCQEATGGCACVHPLGIRGAVRVRLHAYRHKLEMSLLSATTAARPVAGRCCAVGGNTQCGVALVVGKPPMHTLPHTP